MIQQIFSVFYTGRRPFGYHIVSSNATKANSRHRVRILAACCIWVMSIASGAGVFAAPVVLDQSNLILPPTSGRAVVSQAARAQTFEVGTTGQLARVVMQLWKSPDAVGEDVTFRLLNTLRDGSPTSFSQPLFETTIPLSSIESALSVPAEPPLFAVDLLPGDVHVSMGDVLAISLSREARGAPPWVVWGSTAPDTYAAGAHYTSTHNGTNWRLSPGDPDQDVGFQTYVVVPEPSSVWLLLIGGGICVARRRVPQ